jgi:hypothetical protein
MRRDRVWVQVHFIICKEAGVELDSSGMRCTKISRNEP